jgi:hypothetical protein
VAIQIQIRISAEDGDLDRLEQAAAGLRAELLQLDVDDVIPLGVGKPPPGTRGAVTDISLISGVLVTVNQAPVLLGHLVGVVRHWLGRERGGRTAELVIGGDSLVVTGITSAEQERLVEAWLRAHSRDQITQG